MARHAISIHLPDLQIGISKRQQPIDSIDVTQILKGSFDGLIPGDRGRSSPEVPNEQCNMCNI